MVSCISKSTNISQKKLWIYSKLPVFPTWNCGRIFMEITGWFLGENSRQISEMKVESRKQKAEGRKQKIEGRKQISEKQKVRIVLFKLFGMRHHVIQKFSDLDTFLG